MRQGTNSYINNKKVPQILALAASRVEEWSISSWKWLTRIRAALLQRFHDDGRVSSRNIRSEQREAISALLKTLLSFLDLNTMCVGIYHQETDVFVHLSLEFLAKKAGLNIRRAQRAMSWLYQSGYIIGYRQSSYDAETDQYFHKPSIRRINQKLLLDLGITPLALQTARTRSKRQFEKIILNSLSSKKEKNLEKGFDIKQTIKSFVKSFSIPSKQKINSIPPAYLVQVEKLQQLMPHLSSHEAKRMLPTPDCYA